MECLRRKRIEFLLVFGLFLLLAYLLFSNTFGNAWTYDDGPVIVQNPDVRSISGFLQDSYPGRPLRELTYLVDYFLFGLNPAGWHIQNIFWHALNSSLLFVLVRALGGGRSVAWVASLLFVAHPIQVEVVANISHRKDSLALAFSLFSVLSYMEIFRAGRRRWRWLFVALGFAGLACLGKENALVLPLVFIAYELGFVSPERRMLLRGYRWLPPLLALAGIGGGISWYVFGGGREIYLLGAQGLFSKMNATSGVEEWEYFLTVCKSWGFMLRRLFAPSDLAIEYAFAIPRSLFDPWVMFALAGIFCSGLLLWVARKRCPLLFFGLAWSGLFWLPVSNLWPSAYFAADRYLYAPSVGFCLGAAWLLHRFGGRRLAIGLSGAMLVGLMTLTWQQNLVWQSQFSLYSQAVKVSPQSPYALNNLGVYLWKRGERQKALTVIEKAAQNPFYYEAQVNMVNLCEWMGDLERAAYYRRRAITPHGARSL